MKSNTNISQGRLDRLEQIGFQWNTCQWKIFEKLEAFQEEQFGHCNAPTSYPDKPALGPWCKEMIIAYKKLQK